MDDNFSNSDKLKHSSDYTVRNIWIIANSLLVLYVVFLVVLNKCSKREENFNFETGKKSKYENSVSYSNKIIKESVSIQEN
jgi:hypothetical protein